MLWETLPKDPLPSEIEKLGRAHRDVKVNWLVYGSGHPCSSQGVDYQLVIVSTISLIFVDTLQTLPEEHAHVSIDRNRASLSKLEDLRRDDLPNTAMPRVFHSGYSSSLHVNWGYDSRSYPVCPSARSRWTLSKFGRFLVYILLDHGRHGFPRAHPGFLLAGKGAKIVLLYNVCPRYVQRANDPVLDSLDLLFEVQKPSQPLRITLLPRRSNLLRVDGSLVLPPGYMYILVTMVLHVRRLNRGAYDSSGKITLSAIDHKLEFVAEGSAGTG
ncbi:hypothetical protein NMY22_g15682 [Coprinellus aureogranulatus]|nr:hypothetical protein NMY22_g15682 [Coprinellus aureogranulatus]